MKYTVVYQRRKSVGVYVLPDGSVEVRAPFGCPNGIIEQMVLKNTDWIVNRQKTLQDQQGQRRCVPETVRLLGKKLPIAPSPDGKVFFDSANGRAYLPKDCTMEEVMPAMEKEYRRLAQEMLPDRVQEMAAAFGLRVRRVGITGACGRWGSCSSGGSVNFTWRVMMASPCAIDSVIIHELMHFFQPNHSPAFRKLERENTPHFEACQKELRELAQQIREEGWL